MKSQSQQHQQREKIMNNQARIIILGAGHAGGTLVSQLRSLGHAGTITLVGDETQPPYNRPPLSKAYLQGKTELDALLLKNAEYYQEQNIELVCGVTAQSIDPLQRQVVLSDNRQLGYDKLILATGARPRSLPTPGMSLANVLSLRTAQDAQQLQSLFTTPGKRVVLIGGGYIGLELAASAVAMGLDVTVVERESRLLARVASEAISTFFLDEHQKRGVNVLLDTQLEEIIGSEKAEAVRLSNGQTLACDVVLIGAGVVPNVELASAIGIECNNGITVNIHGQTSDADIYAIGDVSSRPLPLYNNRFARVESVPNAMEQAKLAACHILGLEQPKAEVQWFWSDQYEYKLQIAGMAFEYDQTVIRGEPAGGKFSVLRLKEGILQSAECINSPVDFMAAKQLVLNQQVIDTAQATDPALKLKDCLISAVTT
jgi:3-phenylpropionate/trans-cinnamate dioxygenase ferredoxin reductase subunit